jgi:hypothetical protein
MNSKLSNDFDLVRLPEFQIISEEVVHHLGVVHLVSLYLCACVDTVSDGHRA